MKYLLDTHYMIWTIMESRRIPKKSIDIITDPANEMIVSVISFWEISLKSSLGKIHLQHVAPQDLPQLCKK
ncbi:PIN domain-containing protein [Niabella ginsengisoli]|uniref:Type II toxin-antitoxin system VapC family toxin n=1 Tax=Niabella ginsengisoli TaxID=522298 RepID=A0ABS9SE79_9BACT|nr:hypothetical protein [Niabella ginsengisoli]MCH5596667.1 hypothetical protein [Niabella ginsengisoli]